MLPFTDVTGLAGADTAIVAGVLTLPEIRDLPRPRLALLLTAVAALGLVPFGALPPAAFVRGVIGDLSITTTVLLVRAIVRPFSGWGPIQAKDRLALQAVVAAAGLVLYPLALGIGPFDPYRLGFGDSWSMGLVLLLALAALVLHLHLLALCLALGVLGYATAWHESTNLWDYLIDPLVWVYALAGSLVPSARARWNRPRTGLQGRH
jgi:hypothetical protein